MTRLLVLDDMPAIGRMFEEIAVEFEFETQLAMTPDEFETLLAQFKPGLVVVDMVFPGGNGLQILRFLESTHYRGAVILMSGLDDRLLTAACELAIALGLDVIGAVRKPFRARTIRELFVKVAARDPVFAATDFRAALANSEIVVHYQPVVDMASREVLGVEALVRWARPHHGLTMPADFLPGAAREGLMPAITFAVLDIALAEAKRWKQDGFDLGVAIKIPADVLSSAKFCEQVSDAIGRIGPYRPRLTIELTESEVTRYAARMMEAMSVLADSGVAMAIDDFGAGYSSLTELRRLPISRLKVDKSFVLACAHDADASAIAQAAIDLSHTLGMKAVAEGVETQAAWDRLLEHRCDAAQGYFIAHPMPGAELYGWIDRWHRGTTDRVLRSEIRRERTISH